MVNKITEYMQMSASVIMIVLIVMSMAGCSSYQLGDVSRVYCGSTNEEIRADIKATLSDKGVSIGVDYCSSFGLADALIVRSDSD